MNAQLRPENIDIRPMTDEDLLDVMRIEEAGYSHPWTIGIFRDCLRVGYFCQVLEQDNVVVGHAVMSEAVGEAHILNICVSPRAQGAGLGRILVEHLLDAAARMSVEIVLLEVRPSNKIAVGLYHRLGFCEVGSRKSYYPTHDGREDALIMALNL